ncbi:MAG: hypothetical protein A2731_00900 [Candidatus Buchananbacteria bacterium RIFCSPHIGHO2_01_FULL_39_8]|uniref:Transcription elongation factor GreA/GreB C-terminal domain-containing protein n=1 Tax=Candidatus Buchananbacteria bacterium RIFCSPHIGHO2_01_FULL_39_8 TaxID=1797533 RepID=A0A1G1XZ66_9BACT|nr:MAG: hypothetical protein A2731_00900 [Candidatus Buchananbacteria bacterium RIFCSPHIGHO2_01_FULL_39_8]
MPKEITIGSKIIIEINGQIKNLQIVGSADVDVNHGKISYLSPIGESLLGRKVGEIVEVKLANGKVIKTRIVKIY